MRNAAELTLQLQRHNKPRQSRRLAESSPSSWLQTQETPDRLPGPPAHLCSITSRPVRIRLHQSLRCGPQTEARETLLSRKTRVHSRLLLKIPSEGPGMGNPVLAMMRAFSNPLRLTVRVKAWHPWNKETVHQG